MCGRRRSKRGSLVTRSFVSALYVPRQGLPTGNHQLMDAACCFSPKHAGDQKVYIADAELRDNSFWLDLYPNRIEVRAAEQGDWGFLVHQTLAAVHWNFSF